MEITGELCHTNGQFMLTIGEPCHTVLSMLSKISTDDSLALEGLKLICIHIAKTPCNSVQPDQAPHFFI